MVSRRLSARTVGHGVDLARGRVPTHVGPVCESPWELCSQLGLSIERTVFRCLMGGGKKRVRSLNLAEPCRSRNRSTSDSRSAVTPLLDSTPPCHISQVGTSTAQLFPCCNIYERL